MQSNHFRYQNDPFDQNSIFQKTIKQIFMYLLALSLCKISTKSLKWIQSYDDVPFSYQNGTFAPNKTFFKKTINISSIYLLTPFIVKNFKNILGAYPKLQGRAIFRPKMTHLPRKKFFSENPFSNLVAFIHVYHMLRVICQSINEILTIKEYWNLKSESIFGHTLRIRFFPHVRFSQNAKGSQVLSFYTISRQN